MNTFHYYIVAFCFITASGCAMNGDKVAVETELRDKEATIRQLEQRVAQSERLLTDQDREIETLRTVTTNDTKAAKPDADPKVPFSNVSATTETRAAWGSVSSLGIHKLTSGIVKNASGEGQSLNVVLQPLDEDDELVKVAAILTLTASTVLPDGTTSPLITKSFDLTESRRLWSRTLVASGFHIQESLSADQAAALQATADGKLLIHATMELAPDRVYSASELIGVE